jgi:hypothetical protein
MKEYVRVSDALLKQTGELAKFFKPGYAYTSSLKPKPTKKTRAGHPRKALALDPTHASLLQYESVTCDTEYHESSFKAACVQHICVEFALARELLGS